jgi:DNA-binding transcriptional LysR family regulator
MVLSRARLTPSGRLRVDMPVAFGRLKIVPLLGEFRAKYPDVTLSLSFTDRYVDLVEEGVDIAVRMGALQDSSLVARRLMGTQFRVYGAPSYFARHGRPRTPDDLAQHDCIALALRETRLVRDWRFRQGSADLTLTPRGTMTFSDGAAICTAACAGHGLAQMHDYYADGPVAQGLLDRVLQRFEPAADTVSLVYPPTRHLSPKVRVFVDFVTAKLRQRAAR